MSIRIDENMHEFLFLFQKSLHVKKPLLKRNFLTFSLSTEIHFCNLFIFRAQALDRAESDHFYSSDATF